MSNWLINSRISNDWISNWWISSWFNGYQLMVFHLVIGKLSIILATVAQLQLMLHNDLTSLLEVWISVYRSSSHAVYAGGFICWTYMHIHAPELYGIYKQCGRHICFWHICSNNLWSRCCSWLCCGMYE